MISTHQPSYWLSTNTPSGSLAHRGNFLKALTNSCTHTPLIIKSRETMWSSLTIFFLPYLPSARNLNVKIADGSLYFVASKTSIHISDSIILECVLYIPKLSCNLLSISQLTKCSNCYAKFLSSHYAFQGLSLGKMIGSAKECKGLYYVESAKVSE